ncbi:MAG: hypothetical protein MUO73_01015 [Thermoplasmata archaeon]|nr:hypothetical protein [Thermoplasmata archaeon]
MATFSDMLGAVIDFSIGVFALALMCVSVGGLIDGFAFLNPIAFSSPMSQAASVIPGWFYGFLLLMGVVLAIRTFLVGLSYLWVTGETDF